MIIIRHNKTLILRIKTKLITPKIKYSSKIVNRKSMKAKKKLLGLRDRANIQTLGMFKRLMSIFQICESKTRT